SLPEHATVLATGQACPVQMFRVGTRQYSTQFHPELDVPAIIERARAYRDHGYFSPDQMEEVFEALAAVTADQPPTLLRAYSPLLSRRSGQQRHCVPPSVPFTCTVIMCPDSLACRFAGVNASPWRPARSCCC